MKRISKKIRILREERDYWYGRARMDSASLSRTLARVKIAEKNLQEAEQNKGDKNGKRKVNGTHRSNGSNDRNV